MSEFDDDERSSRLGGLLGSQIAKLVLAWGVVTLILVQLVKLVAPDYAFFDNPGPLLAISFIIAWFFRNPPRSSPTWAIQPFVKMIDGTQSMVGGLIRFAWTILVLCFVVLLVHNCSENPNAQFSVVVRYTLDQIIDGVKAFISGLIGRI
jgi:quinol-cytochrome oxidoreductase complex cytochrome b subunit